MGLVAFSTQQQLNEHNRLTHNGGRPSPRNYDLATAQVSDLIVIALDNATGKGNRGDKGRCVCNADVMLWIPAQRLNPEDWCWIQQSLFKKHIAQTMMLPESSEEPLDMLDNVRSRIRQPNIFFGVKLQILDEM